MTMEDKKSKDRKQKKLPEIDTKTDLNMLRRFLAFVNSFGLRVKEDYTGLVFEKYITDWNVFYNTAKDWNLRYVGDKTLVYNDRSEGTNWLEELKNHSSEVKV